MRVLAEAGEGMGTIDMQGGAAEDAEEGEEVEAEVYVWVAGKHRLKAQEWDFGEFVKEKMGRWVGREAQGEYAGRASIIGTLASSIAVAERW